MINLLTVICFILFVSSCATTPKENISSHITILDKVDFAKLDMDTFNLREYLEHRRYNSVKIDLLNNSDSDLYYWTNSCSWQSNWILDNNSITWYVMCPKNIPILVKLLPRDSKSYYGLVEFTDSTFSAIKKFKIGFVFVRKNEVQSDFDFIPILRDKIENKKDIFWSNSLKPKQKN
jgi:hypothetical protein